MSSSILDKALIAIFVFVYLAVAACGMSGPSKPEPKRCTKVWDKSINRVVYECVPLSQSTLDGER